MLTIQEIYNECAEKTSLTWIAGAYSADRSLAHEAGHSADMVGHLNFAHPARIQVFGKEEYTYFFGFDPGRRRHHLEDLVAGGVPAIIIAENLAPAQDLLDFCQDKGIPLLASSLSSAEVIDVLRIYLSKRLAPTTIVHGVMLDVLGLGVLIQGESGLGKSELALELISRGHGLVADDAVELARIAPNIIEGHCPPLIQNLLEVRGIGLLDIRTIFGETSVRRKMLVRLVVQLARSLPENFERLPAQQQTTDILGVPLRTVTLQVAAGRNLAVLVEAAVRNTILALRGIDTMDAFIRRQSQAIAQSSDAPGSSC
jgi:HPr kinase/phosphorylase